MNRREFVTTGVSAGVGALGLAGSAAAQQNTQGQRAQESQSSASSSEPFQLKYAPHFGMFRHSAGEDLVDQIQFAHDHGFRAWEDNGMMRRDPQTQERIGKALADRDMTMGVFVADGEFGQANYALGGKETRTALQEKMKQAVECAKRVNAKWCTIVPGRYDLKLAWDYQTANVIDTLKAMCEIAEPAGLVMVLEPLNERTNHPGQFLTEIPQAYMICRSVGSPSCKILDDLYHQQITEGNLIPNMDMSWDEIAYFQAGDNPGRKEPTTGEINYKNVFAHIHAKGFDGVVGMEHGNSKPGKEGEQAVIEAYRQVDGF